MVFGDGDTDCAEFVLVCFSYSVLIDLKCECISHH